MHRYGEPARFDQLARIHQSVVKGLHEFAHRLEFVGCPAGLLAGLSQQPIVVLLRAEEQNHVLHARSFSFRSALSACLYI